MSLLQIVLALACFGIGFLIADGTITSSPVTGALIIAAVVVISLILRRRKGK